MSTPVPEYAQRRLESRRWRLARSWWVLVPLVTFGVLPWASYIWAGVKTAERKYYISAGIWFAASLLWGLVLPSAAPSLVPLVAISCVFLPAMQAIVMNRQYLVERAIRDL
ncbi:hypothetical protein [Demequina mangrovi]|uniref:Uncharacterized protein n=1 Tax=Demequina mangrovi TaxID=1043493 RepID=A0A1H6ZHN6_9MICO|nr:hypothetical protein [Demequina mangrovi]SEJ52216.1 hypothetical protein SAMN05421637_2129 [Demequina mangrovi]